MLQDSEVIVTNMKKRYTGVSGTINALLPIQSETLKIAFVGEPMSGCEVAASQNPGRFQSLSVWQAIQLSLRRLPDGRPRIWHVRRDPEMVLTIFLRDVLRLPIRLVFTSAAKHRHSWFPRWLISKMDAVIATTPEAAKLVPNTTQVVFHGASLARFTPPADKNTIWARTGLPGQYGIGIFGRIRPQKGSDIFVDALLSLLPAFPDFCAIITGQAIGSEDKNYQDKLIAKIAAQGLSERIRFLGDVPNQDIPLWYQNVSIMVACPRYEPFGITPLEAMASGCAVVASDTGAFAYLVEAGKTGYIVPTDDVSALADKLRLLMQNPELAIQMGQAGLVRVAAQFSIQHEAAGIRTVYDKVWQQSAA